MSNTTKTQKNDIDTCIRVFKIGRVALAAVIIAGLVNAVDFTTYAAAFAYEGGAQVLFVVSVLTFVWAMPVYGIYMLRKTSAEIVILKREKELAEEH